MLRLYQLGLGKIYTAHIEIKDPDAFARSIEIVAWAFAHFGEPTNHNGIGTWGLDAGNGELIFDFMNKADYTAFVLTWF